MSNSTPAASTIRLALRIAEGLAHGALRALRGRVEGRLLLRLSPACTPLPDDAIVIVMHCVCILRCADGSLYIGSTDDLDTRLRRHREGRGATFTAMRLPVSLAYSESVPTRPLARRREAQIKRWTTA